MKFSRRDFGKTALALAAAGVSASSLELVGCSTAWIDTVEADLPVVINIVGSIVAVIGQATGNGLLSGTVAAALQLGATALTASLEAFRDAFNAYTANKNANTLAKLIAALQSAQADAQKVIAALPAGSVSTTVQTIIIAGIGTVVTILSSIQALLPGAASAAVTLKATANASASKIVLPNAAALKAGFESVLLVHPLK